MIEDYVPRHDQRHDDFYERFLEHRVGKLNSFTVPPAEDTIPFPIRPLPTAPVVALHKRDSITSSDLGVGSPHVFSPTLPITPEQLPQHPQETETEQPSTSAPTRPLTPFNDFCGTVEGPKRENKNTSDLSHTIPILNRFYVSSLVRAINSGKQQFVVAQYSLTFLLSRNSLLNCLLLLERDA